MIREDIKVVFRSHPRRDAMEESVYLRGLTMCLETIVSLLKLSGLSIARYCLHGC
jgi:hypothetical protein